MDTQQSVLIVEDDLYSRDLYKEVLQNTGLAVETAQDGAEGLEKAQAGGHALMILDVMLPVRDGLSILKSLKDNPPEKPNGPVILLTNLARDQVMKDAKELGVAECFTKTDITPGQLVESVKKLITPN